MPEVRIGSEIKTYPQGTAYAEIAEEYQKNYENDILLVSVNGRLGELHKTLQGLPDGIYHSGRYGWLSGISEKCRLSDDESLSECGRQGKCEKYHGLLFC